MLVDERALLQTARHALPPGAARAPAPDDQFLGRLVLLAGAALGLAPRAHRMATARGLALAAAEGVVDGVHGHAARLGPHALPAVAARLAEGHELGLGVAHLADRRPAVDRNPAHFSAGKAEGGEVALLGDQLDAGARAPAHAPAGTRLELDVVHRRTDGDIAQRQGVAWPNLRTLPALQAVTYLHPRRGEDVALLPVDVMEKSDAR